MGSELVLDLIIEHAKSHHLISEPVCAGNDDRVDICKHIKALKGSGDGLGHEVLAVGDFKFREKSSKLMESFHDTDKTILIVSHSASDIDRLCDYVFWLEDGVLKMEGAPSLVLGKYHAS